MDYAAAQERQRELSAAVAANSTKRSGRAETRSGTITLIRTNKAAIILSADALVSLIDQKLASLRESRSNEDIAGYEDLKLQVQALRGLTLRVIDGDEAREEVVERAANTFGDFAHRWWEKHGERPLT